MKLTLPTIAALLAGLLVAGTGCPHRVKVEPVEVKPIHMTIDINIKVDRELDKFFDFEDEAEAENEGTDESASTSPDTEDGEGENQ